MLLACSVSAVFSFSPVGDLNQIIESRVPRASGCLVRKRRVTDSLCPQSEMLAGSWDTSNTPYEVVPTAALC